MRSVHLLLLAMAVGLGSVGLRAEAPVPAPAVAAPLGTSVSVTLKDGQTAQLTLVTYDSFFLTAVNAKGTRFDIPWTEVAGVDAPGAGADLALMRGHITPGPGPVSSVVEPRSPGTALARAVWPGVLLHGAGLSYAGSNDAFVDLAGAEFFGVVVGAFGAYLEYYPNSSDSSKTVPQVLTIAGAAIFVGTWLWDLSFSYHAARSFNERKGLALEPAPGGAQLSYLF